MLMRIDGAQDADDANTADILVIDEDDDDDADADEVDIEEDKRSRMQRQ